MCRFVRKCFQGLEWQPHPSRLCEAKSHFLNSVSEAVAFECGPGRGRSGQRGQPEARQLLVPTREVHRSERREFARSKRRLFTRSDRRHVNKDQS